MYSWYKSADVCYAYLQDVPTGPSAVHQPGGQLYDENIFRQSEWFSRGWTLQELIAPSILEFYASDWSEIGTKTSLRETLVDVTGIDDHVLDGNSISIYNIAQRFSWASSRLTTRPEDRAYSLLGIFEVNMPLLYGEGGERAFRRLQEEILKRTEDYTVLAWGLGGGLTSAAGSGCSSAISCFEAEHMVSSWGGSIKYMNVLADDIQQYAVPNRLERSYSDIRLVINFIGIDHVVDDVPLVISSRGLRLNLPLRQCSKSRYLAYINCQTKANIICIALELSSTSPNTFYRIQSRSATHAQYFLLPPGSLASFKSRSIYIAEPWEPLILANRSYLPRRLDSIHDLEVQGPNLSHFCGWDLDEDNKGAAASHMQNVVRSVSGSAGRSHKDELVPNIIRCLYQNKFAFVVILYAHECSILSCLDSSLVSLAGNMPIYHDGTWDRGALNCLRNSIPTSRSGTPSRDRVSAHFKTFSVHVAYKRLAGRVAVRLRVVPIPE